jgi:hypothetical protein
MQVGWLIGAHGRARVKAELRGRAVARFWCLDPVAYANALRMCGGMKMQNQEDKCMPFATRRWSDSAQCLRDNAAKRVRWKQGPVSWCPHRTGRRHYQLVMAVAATFIVAACTREQTSDSLPMLPSIRDSAGVRIVEHAAEFEADRWRVEDRPLLELGRADGRPFEEFHLIAGAHRFDDGRVAVADGGSRQIRLFSPRGEFLGAVGGEGGGPGEFRDLTWTARCGLDSLFAYDFTRRNVSIFDSNGRYVRAFRLEMPGGRALVGVASCNSRRQFLLEGFPRSSPERGAHRPVAPIAVIDMPTGAANELGEFPGLERHGRVVGGRLVGDFTHPFGRVTIRALSATAVFIGTGESYEISEYDFDGNERAIIRVSQGREPLAQPHVDEALRNMVERTTRPERREEWRRWFALTGFPDSLPPYGVALIDGSEHLWVGPHPSGVREVPIYNVFAPDGAMVARVELPAGFRVFEIGEQHIVGVSRDDVDVERVQVYRLDRR